MINKLLKTYGLLFLLSVIMISCKKDKTEPNGKKDVLTGAWEEVSQKAYSKRLLFEPGGNFSMQIRDKDNQYWALLINGKYTISGNNLIVNSTSETERSSVGIVINSGATNYPLFDKGKFSIEDYVLTINYTTYPADAPVPTIAKFNKLIPID